MFRNDFLSPLILTAILFFVYFMINASESPVMESEMNNSDLEDLFYKYGTDKSKDDHGYSDFYSILFDSIKDTVTNMTEIGISGN